MALQIKCYCPEFTFVEKLQAISTKCRQHQKNGRIPANFIRHYYDVYRLLDYDRVKNFIGTEQYYEHKDKRFSCADEKNLLQNDAFTVLNSESRKVYEREFSSKKDLYFQGQPSFQEILDRIQNCIDKL